MIGVWPYIDSTLVTQRDPQGLGEQVPNTLENGGGTAHDEHVSSGSREADVAVYISLLTLFTEGSLDITSAPNWRMDAFRSSSTPIQ